MTPQGRKDIAAYGLSFSGTALSAVVSIYSTWLRSMLSSVTMIGLLLASRNPCKIILWTRLRCAQVQVLMTFARTEDTESFLRKCGLRPESRNLICRRGTR